MHLISKTCEKRIPTWFRMILFIPTHIAVERIYPSLVCFAHSGVIILTTATSVGISLSHLKTMWAPYSIYQVYQSLKMYSFSLHLYC